MLWTMWSWLGKDKIHVKGKRLYRSMIFKPFMKVLIMLGICLGFYFGLIYGPESIAKQLFNIEIYHTNFGGMRRMLSPLTFFWAREAVFEMSGLASYIQIVPNFQISTSYAEMIE